MPGSVHLRLFVCEWLRVCAVPPKTMWILNWLCLQMIRGPERIRFVTALRCIDIRRTFMVVVVAQSTVGRSGVHA